MSLQTKFAILLGILGLAVLTASVSAWWTLRFMHVQVREPFQSMSSALQTLRAIKRGAEEQATFLGGTTNPDGVSMGVRGHAPEAEPTEPPSPVAAERDEFLVSIEMNRDYMSRLFADEWSASRVGSSTLRNLDARIESAKVLGSAWFDLSQSDSPPGDPEPRRAAVAEAHRAALLSLFQIHEVIERIEKKILDDSVRALEHSMDMRGRLNQFLATVLLIAALTAVLGVVLVRRWVLRPVASLRSAAARIAAGDFEHRLAIPTGRPDELGLLSAEVNHMAGMVKAMQDERVEREKFAAVGEMMRTIVHNLRDPLSGIRSLAEVTRDELAHDPARTDLHEAQGRIMIAVDRFSEWLNGLLRITKPTTVLPALNEVSPWLEGVVEAHRPLAQTKAVEIVLDQQDGPRMARFDPVHLEHALVAIVSNAIDATASDQGRHPSPNGRPSVRIASRVVGAKGSEGSGGIWEIRVIDQGPGVPIELRDKVFEPYFTTKAKGSGIGLAVAQQVVRSHGGRITIENGSSQAGFASKSGSNHREGATFVLSIPLGTADSGGRMANTGQYGELGGQDSDHRG